MFCCFFVKHPGRPVISILKTSTQREGRNNAAAFNLLKSDSLRVDVFFGSAFAVDLAGVTKLFFVVVSETSILHLISHVSKNSLCCFWHISGIASETMKHIYLECLCVKQLWNHSRLFLTNDIFLPTQTPQTVIFGFIKGIKNNIYKITNDILSIFKIHVYKSRKRGTLGIK